MVESITTTLLSVKIVSYLPAASTYCSSRLCYKVQRTQLRFSFQELDQSTSGLARGAVI